MRSAFSRSHVKSGRTRSMPSMSSSGNMSPQSRSMMLAVELEHAQLRPISPSPPRNVMRDGWAMAAAQPSRPRPSSTRRASASSPAGAGPERQAARPDGQAERAQHRLGRLGGLGDRRWSRTRRTRSSEALSARARVDVALARRRRSSRRCTAPAQWVATPMTPTAPTASSGSVIGVVAAVDLEVVGRARRSAGPTRRGRRRRP